MTSLLSTRSSIGNGTRAVAGAVRGGKCCVRAAAEDTSIACVPLNERSQHYRKLNHSEIDVVVIGSAPSDYYSLLNVDLDASDATIRDGYRRLQRLVHPDRAGELATDLAAHINCAYATLTDPHARAAYSSMVKMFRAEMGAFNGAPVSEWCGSASDTHALFVDETMCIGCQHCAFSAPSTFFVEELHGRARVAKQWADSRESIKDAMDMCPVSCIHLVPRAHVALLEYVMKACKREDTAILARRRTGNMASSVGDNPFARADSYIKKTSSTSHLRVEAATTHDHVLAAAIAKAWKKLPDEILLAGWPEFAAGHRDE